MSQNAVVELTMFCALAVCVGVSAVADAATHHTSPVGNDTTGDGSESTPWRTISYTVNEASSGDTIKVMDDDDEATDDYVENVTVDKNLTIVRHDDTGANPQIAASNANHYVVYVTADSVTIEGLDIYGAKVGIYLDDVSKCTIRNNRCGWDSDHRSINGIYLDSSSNNAVLDNTCNSNRETGILLISSSSKNIITGNTCGQNRYDGIALYYSCNSNIVSDNICPKNDDGIQLCSSGNNTVSGNVCTSYRSGGYGIHLCSSSKGNTVSGNICSRNSGGIYLNYSDNNIVSGNMCSNNQFGITLKSSSHTVSGNTCSNNTYGIYLYDANSNNIYLNNFVSNTTNVHSHLTTTSWRSSIELSYLYGGSGRAYKRSVGNYYSDYVGSDNDDGIGDNLYNTGAGGDRYPLIQITDNYSFQAWYLADRMMYQGDMSTPGAIISIAGDSSRIWVADQPAQMDISFGAGDPSDWTSWTGLIRFRSAPASGETFAVEVGYADDQEGSNFQGAGPEAILTGDDSTTAFIYTTDAVPFTTPQGKYLALTIANNSTSSDAVRVGGSWSYIAAPQGSQDYLMEPVAVSLPDSVGVPLNSPCRVPVFVSDVTGQSFISLQTVLTYDSSIIYPTDILTDGTMTEGWDVDFSTVPGNSPDTLKVAMATAQDTLSGAGTLFILRVESAEGASVGDSTLLHFESFLFNEDMTLANTQDGVVYITEPVRLRGDVTGNGAVTSLDAAWILQHTAGLLFLTGVDSVVADVTGDSTLSALDASLVLQYVVGKISQFPVDEPVAKVVYAPRVVQLGKVDTLTEGQARVPIEIDEMDDVVAGEFELSFSGSPGDIAINTTDQTSGYLLAHNVRDGRIRVAFAGAQPGSGAGPILEIVFDEPDVDALNSLRLEHVSLNEGMIPVWIVQEAETPRAYRLSQNYPNPFNAETMIAYDIAEPGPVRLSVYALTGQLVRTLVDADRQAGSYSVTWDGRDTAGHPVATGVYACRMETREHRAARKMLLVK